MDDSVVGNEREARGDKCSRSYIAIRRVRDVSLLRTINDRCRCNYFYKYDLHEIILFPFIISISVRNVCTLS